MKDKQRALHSDPRNCRARARTRTSAGSLPHRVCSSAVVGVHGGPGLSRPGQLQHLCSVLRLGPPSATYRHESELVRTDAEDCCVVSWSSRLSQFLKQRMDLDTNSCGPVPKNTTVVMVTTHIVSPTHSPRVSECSVEKISS